MSQFVAIPVSLGDAFYLNRNDYSILIDGGLDEAGFPTLFLNTIKSDNVNVVVCTHNDADHANGILGFLKAGLSCDEVWLPGSWIGVLPDILGPFHSVLTELAENILDDRRQYKDDSLNPEAPTLETYFEERKALSELNADDKRETSGLYEDGWSAQLVELLEMSVPWDSVSLLHWINRLVYPYYVHHFDEAEIQLLWSAIEAASRIRAIAQAAFHRGIPVRWFEYDTNSPSGGNSYLRPLNAKEIATVRVRPAGTLLYLLSLSVSNKESLVFWSPPMEQHPGVLFNADSDLANVQLPSNSELLGALATAPHHGSEANANAYLEVARAAPTAYSTVTWVRSDGRSTKRPGAAYLGLGRNKRACTICRISAKQFTKKYAVVAQTAKSGTWQVLSAQCTCR